MSKDIASRDALLKVVHEIGQQYISDDEFATQFEDARDFAYKQEEKEGEFSLMFIAHLRHRTEKDTSKTIPVIFPDWPPDDKIRTMFALGVELSQRHPDYILVSVIHMAEAYMANYASEDVDNNGYMPKDVPTPSERPDRTEVLIIDGCTLDMRKKNYTLPIIRNSRDKFMGWGVEVSMDGGDAQNYLIANIFKGALSNMSNNLRK